MAYEKDEIALIAQLQDEFLRERAFNQIVKLYQQQIYWQIRKMVLCHDDANDVLQNTFIKAWNALESFRGESKISTWLYRIAVNESLTFLSKQRQKTGDLEDVMLHKMEADSYFDGDEIALKLQQAILTLPDKQRLVFNMKYFDDMKYEEMEEILGTSVGALKASYHLAVKKIEAFFNGIEI
jgi:RNA polymerase sigma-70 factor (ECF subfamily)